MTIRTQSTLFITALLVLLSATGCTRLGIGGSSDLLNGVRPMSDAVAGRWRFEDRALMSEHAPNARITLPVVPYGDYRIKMEFTRIIGDGAVALILPAGDRQVLLLLDGGAAGAPASGLELIDGLSASANVTANRNFSIANNQRYVVEATVRTRLAEGSVDVDVDGLPFVRWTGSLSALELPSEWALTPPATLGLGANECVVQVHRVTAAMIPGETSWLPR